MPPGKPLGGWVEETVQSITAGNTWAFVSAFVVSAKCVCECVCVCAWFQLVSTFQSKAVFEKSFFDPYPHRPPTFHQRAKHRRRCINACEPTPSEAFWWILLPKMTLDHLSMAFSRWDLGELGWRECSDWLTLWRKVWNFQKGNELSFQSIHTSISLC